MNDDTIEAKITLNEDPEKLPFGYFCPESEGKLIWMCGEDKEGKITSVFMVTEGGEKKKQCTYLKDIEEAKSYRETLLQNGWRKLIPPKVILKYPGGDKEGLNRKQKRYIQRKIKHINNLSNPFE